MEFINDKDMVQIFDKRSRVSTVVNKLALLSAEQVRDFFSNREVKLPRKLNCLALMSVLNEKIPLLNSKSLPKDMFIKLQNYKNFSEFQLQALFDKICDEEDYNRYRVRLWTLVLKNYELLNLADGEVQHLMNIKKKQVEDFSTYNNILCEVSVDYNRYFDGILAKDIETHLNEYFSTEELKKLANKYGYQIGSRLKKEEYIGYIKMYLKSKRKLTVALSNEIDSMTAVQLSSLCQVHEIELSPNLKKNELVFLLQFLIKKDKLTTSILKENVIDNGIKPLEFEVDTYSIDNFGRGEAKKVIILPEDKVEEKQEPINEPSRPFSNEELINEIAKKLGIIINDSKAEEPKQEEIPEEVEKPKMTPAERLALARKRKQELAKERMGTEETAKVTEPEKPKMTPAEILAMARKRKQDLANQRMMMQREEVEEDLDRENENHVLDLNEENVESNSGEFIEDNFETLEKVEVDEQTLESVDDIEYDEEIKSNFEDVDIETSEEELSDVDIETSEEELSDADIETSEEELSHVDINEDHYNEENYDNEEAVLVESDSEEVIESVDNQESSLELNDLDSTEEIEIEKAADESYDPNFDSTEFIDESKIIENPNYKNPKYAPKKISVGSVMGVCGWIVALVLMAVLIISLF